MPYYENFWHKMHKRLRIPNIRYIIICLFDQKLRTSLSTHRARETIELPQYEAIPQTSSLQTFGLPTVLTLILWITGYVEYCSNVFIGNLLKNEH